MSRSSKQKHGGEAAVLATGDSNAKGKQKKLIKQALRAARKSSMAPGLLAQLQSAIGEARPTVVQNADFLEAGVLAYRHSKRRGVEILLISKRRTSKWGIPKGKLVPHLSFSANAAKEAFEEAGVLGRVSPHAVGVFRARKRAENRPAPLTIEVWVYLLEVTERRAKWPEKGKREIRWVSCDAAARQLREPVLAQICHRLGRPE